MAPDVSMCHTKSILWLRHRLQKIANSWNYPRDGLPPRTKPSKDWHIRIKHIWEQWRPSTRTVAENQDVITPEYLDKPYVIISGYQHWVPNDRIEAPSWIGSGGIIMTRANMKPYLMYPSNHTTPSENRLYNHVCFHTVKYDIVYHTSH